MGRPAYQPRRAHAGIEQGRVSDFGKCDNYHQALIEIDHYGERLVGCMECNRWSWRGSQRLLLELPDDDIDALRERVRRARQAG
jgi:hypothetical protein